MTLLDIIEKQKENFKSGNSSVTIQMTIKEGVAEVANFSFQSSYEGQKPYFHIDMEYGMAWVYGATFKELSDENTLKLLLLPNDFLSGL